MGKRNKKHDALEDVTEVMQIKKPKKVKILDAEVDEPKNPEKVKVKKTKKMKKAKNEVNMQSTNSTSNPSTSKNIVGKSNKILFDEDGDPQEVPAGSGATLGETNSQKSKKNKKFLNDDEADVKEEDIDKFCDELEEEDNVQFENWVKLIEEKLHSKKVK